MSTIFLDKASFYVLYPFVLTSSVVVEMAYLTMWTDHVGTFFTKCGKGKQRWSTSVCDQSLWTNLPAWIFLLFASRSLCLIHKKYSIFLWKKSSIFHESWYSSDRIKQSRLDVYMHCACIGQVIFVPCLRELTLKLKTTRFVINHNTRNFSMRGRKQKKKKLLHDA